MPSRRRKIKWRPFDENDARKRSNSKYNHDKPLLDDENSSENDIEVIYRRSEDEIESDSEMSDSDSSNIFRDGIPVNEDYESLSVQEDGEDKYEISSSFYKKNSSESPLLDYEKLKMGIKINEIFVEKCMKQNERNRNSYFYKPLLTTKESISKLLRDPKRFKKCQIRFEGAHKALCKNLDTTDDITDIEISGRSKCRRVFSGDHVVVKILNFERVAAVIIPRLRRDTNENNRRNKVYGEVVGLLKRKSNIKNPVMVCVLDESANYLVKPLCKTVPKLKLMRETENDFQISIYSYNDSSNDLDWKENVEVNPAVRSKYVFLAAYICWSGQYPTAAVIKVFKLQDDMVSAMRNLRLINKVPTLYQKSTVKHTEKLLSDYEEGASKYSSVNYRKDLSDKLRTFTIDDPYSMDLDDALSIETDGKGDYIIGVHIADVSLVVKKDDPVDKEARERATTFYPGKANHAYHMLPEPLATNICSLQPNKKRPTISVFFRMNKQGFFLGDPIIIKAIIKSTKKLSYEEVQKIIDAENVENEIEKDIKLLAVLSRLRRKIRLHDASHWFPIECLDDLTLASLDAYHLVEEFMILTNITVGLFLLSHEQVRHSVILRCQDRPSRNQIQIWEENNKKHIIEMVLKLQNMKFKSDESERLSINNVKCVRWRNILSTQKWIWNDLEKAFKEKDLRKMERLIGTDDVHPLQCLALDEWIEFQENAEYRCLGCLKEPNEEGFHFSLGMYPYVHFTSPIRRYTDIIIHRLVHVVLKGSTEICRYSSEEIQKLCHHVNEVMRQAKIYQKNCQALILGNRLKSKPYMSNAFVKEFSESKIALTFPSMKNIPSKYREIPLCLLHTSSAASIRKTSDKSVMTLTWKRRIYHRNGANSVRKNPYIGNFGLLKKINPHLRAEFVQIMKWRDLVMAVTDGNWEKISYIMTETDDEEETEYMKIKDKLVWTYVKECVNTDYDVSSETPEGELIHQCCHHSMTFDQGQIVSIQLSVVAYNGLLAPFPQLLNISHNSRLCLQHMKDPVQSLSKYSTVKAKSNRYENVHDYLKIWLPILEMEFATRAVGEDSPTINAVPVHFDGQEGYFELRKWFCDERDISFYTMPLNLILNGVNREDGEVEEMANSDFICIRCDMPEGLPPGHSVRSDIPKSGDYIWVAHAQIKVVRIMKKKRRLESEKQDIKSKSDEGNQEERSDTNKKQWTRIYRVEFELRKESYPPPAPMLPENHEPKCCIELIQKSTSDKRIEAVLNCLPKAIPLAKAIALQERIPNLSKSRLSTAANLNVNKPMGNLEQNNDRQRVALEKALKKSFSLIHGPPGTGKTTMGIKLINLFHELNMAVNDEERQIIFCGQSNKSVDLVAKMYRRKFPESKLRLIRIYGTTMENYVYPVPGKHISESSSAKNSKPDPDLSDVSMHNVIRMTENQFCDEIKEYDRKFRRHFEEQEHKKREVRKILIHAQKREKDKFFNDMCTKQKSDKTSSVVLDIKGYNDLITKATIQQLKKYDVIFCTTSVATSPRFLMAVHGHVSQLIIDECGMCTETESMATIIATKPQQVVLIGDHKQLQPFVTCREAADLGLEKSLFERYAKKSAFTFLNLQYRMHPEICKLPSRFFYEDKLETGNPNSWSGYKALDIWPRKDIPHLFVHVEGEEELMTVTTELGNVRSCSNKAEVKQVMKIFRRLWEKEGVHPSEINLMSQYNAQCSAIREALEKELVTYNSKKPTRIDIDNFVNSNVNTVVGSQGAEWNYVIFTTARSLPEYRIEPMPTRGWKKENLGFITDEHQINVALTRAKRGLFIVGNENLLRCDDIWKSLISEYNKGGCLVNGDDFPLKEFKN